jgi:glycosyltransferase involved in cell wall biosynthesis
MKIALFSQDVVKLAYSAVLSGWAHALAANGIKDIDVVSIKGNPVKETLNPFPPEVRHVILPCDRTALALPSLRRYLREDSPDVLISAVVNINLLAIAAMLTSPWKGKLIITHHHPVLLSHEDCWKDNKYASWLLYRFAHGSFANSPEVMEDVIVNCGLDRAKITYVPNVITPPLVTKVPARLHPWLDTEARPGPVFVTVSRLSRVKNIPLLLAAFELIAEKIDARLLVIGEGPEKSRILTIVQQKKLGDRVQLLGFVRSPRPYLRKADAFVLASNEEGFGQVYTEAMSEGLPIVTTDAEGGGSRFVLDGGRFGILVSRGDAQALAEAMVKMADPKVRSRYSELGSQRVLEFHPKRVGAQLLQFLQMIPSRDYGYVFGSLGLIKSRS